MKTSLPCIKLFFSATLVCSLLLSIRANAQSSPALEFASMIGNPTGNGASVSNQVITFQNNTNNPSGNTFLPYLPILTATFSYSNQQYTLPSSQISTSRGLSFGANINNSGTNAPSAALFPQMNSISSPSNSNFTSSTMVTPGTGISITTNRAVGMFTSGRALYNANASTSGRFYFGNLTVTFNQPVVNPVLHVVGLGGYYSSLGFSTELELQTPGVTLSKRSGSNELNVASGNKILNSASNPSSTTGSGAASGTVTAIGAGFTTLSFRVYMRGDGDESTWGSTNMHAGDVWLMGVSVSTVMTNVILPVELSSFTAVLKDNRSFINWSTATEKNVSHFVIEKSFDGSIFKDAGIVFAYGNSDEIKNYRFTDNPGYSPGVIYYRLRTVDLDGNTSNSEIRSVRIMKQPEQALSITVYPNPAIHELSISIPDSWRGKKALYEVLTNSGQSMFKKETNTNNQKETINIAHLAPGFYIVRVNCNNETAMQKIVKR